MMQNEVLPILILLQLLHHQSDNIRYICNNINLLLYFEEIQKYNTVVMKKNFK